MKLAKIKIYIVQQNRLDSLEIDTIPIQLIFWQRRQGTLMEEMIIFSTNDAGSTLYLYGKKNEHQLISYLTT